MNYDAVIIGAGPSGLAAAVRLAHFGIRTCLVEAHTRPGGLNSWHHVKGREISSGLHAFTNYQPGGRGGVLGKLLRQLRIDPAELKLHGPGMAAIRFPGAFLRLNGSPEFFREEIARVFPGETANFDRFRRLILDTDEGAFTTVQTSAREVMAGFIHDPLLADMLFCPVLFYGGPGGVGDGRDNERTLPDMDWLLFCVIWKCMFESGLAYPAGGMSELWESLVRRFQADGGEYRLGNRVASLRVKNGRVTAVVLENGEEIAGEMFFSSAGGRETALLLERNPPATPPPEAGPISIVEGIALLDAQPQTCGIEEAIVFYSTTPRLHFARPEGLVEETSGVLCLPANYPGIADNILKISQLASYPRWRELDREGYRRAKESVGVGMEQALTRLGLVPGRLKSTPGRFGYWDDLFTPLTLERYARHCEGALYGSPRKSRSGATSQSNLFLIGTDQGFHGIVGAMLSGVAMVNLHCLAKRR